MADLKTISDLLVTKGKVRGKPVAISLFRESVPKGYEPIEDEPCTLVRFAMDEGRKVYFDAEHYDCLVGVHHAGMIPGKKEIVSGEYLSKTSSFFTYEGAARLKAGTRSLPPGMVRAIGSAPLDQVPEGVRVDWIVVICNPQNANFISGCRLIQDGVLPLGMFGTSLCGELFSTPWHERNVVVTFGDFGGRMYNRIKQDELFVIIPIEFADGLTKLFVDIKLDAKATLEMTKPPHSKFWKNKKNYEKKEEGEPPSEDSDAPVFTMEWDEEAKELVNKTPKGILEFVVSSAEEFARNKGYGKITKNTLGEQMEELGMNLEDMLGGE